MNTNLPLRRYPRRTVFSNLNRSSFFLRTRLPTKKIVIASGLVTYAYNSYEINGILNERSPVLLNVRITNGVSEIGQPNLNSFVILPRLHRQTAALKLFNTKTNFISSFLIDAK